MTASSVPPKDAQWAAQALRRINETDERFAESLQDVARTSGGCPEIAHQLADRILIDLLASLGCHRSVAAFEAITKWYS